MFSGADRLIRIFVSLFSLSSVIYSYFYIFSSDREFAIFYSATDYFSLFIEGILLVLMFFIISVYVSSGCLLFLKLSMNIFGRENLRILNINPIQRENTNKIFFHFIVACIVYFFLNFIILIITGQYSGEYYSIIIYFCFIIMSISISISFLFYRLDRKNISSCIFIITICLSSAIGGYDRGLSKVKNAKFESEIRTSEKIFTDVEIIASLSKGILFRKRIGDISLLPWSEVLLVIKKAKASKPQPEVP